VPMLIVGYSKRSEYKAWSSRHPVLDHVLRTQVAIQNDSALLTYRGSYESGPVRARVLLSAGGAPRSPYR
jgi:hypothetical protein